MPVPMTLARVDTLSPRRLAMQVLVLLAVSTFTSTLKKDMFTDLFERCYRYRCLSDYYSNSNYPYKIKTCFVNVSLPRLEDKFRCEDMFQDMA